MNKEETIRAVIPTGEIVNCTARYADTAPWKIVVDCKNNGVFQSEGDDLFEAFLEIRKQLSNKDIVNIFDPIERNDIDTTESQKEFYNKWLKSLDPTSKEIEEASKHPNGWVYRIDGNFSDDQQIPSTSIIGAWEVNSEGKLTNKFDMNKEYRPSHPA